MYSSRKKGDIGEDAAAVYLMDRGYLILERNFSTKYGEIDIIARDGDYITFIEVKARRDLKLGLPCEAVNQDKQHRIAQMALLYICKKKLFTYDFRFDVVELLINDDHVKYIRLIKDAFQVA